MSLFQEIKQSAEGRELSLRWYRNKIRSLGGEQKPVTEYIREGDGGASPIFGMMNMFRYQPKTAKNLKYYDVYPLVLVFKRHRNGFTGLNFHYLSIPMRVKVLERLDIFGDDLHVLMFEDVILGCGGEQVASCLNLVDFEFDTLTTPVNSAPRSGPQPTSDLRQRLNEFFKAPNKELADAFGLNISHWSN